MKSLKKRLAHKIAFYLPINDVSMSYTKLNKRFTMKYVRISLIIFFIAVFAIPCLYAQENELS
ncbi:MAG: hypothetical protein FWH35_10745, partial [Treponema sp.]|nr:hypothetical protein [Treponema sp.]